MTKFAKGDTFKDYYADAYFEFEIVATGTLDNGQDVYLGRSDDEDYYNPEKVVTGDFIRKQKQT